MTASVVTTNEHDEKETQTVTVDNSKVIIASTTAPDANAYASRQYISSGNIIGITSMIAASIVAALF